MQSELEEVLALMTRSVERSGNLIESMLALAEASQVPEDVGPVDIGVVVRNVLEEKAERMAADGISVEVSGDLGSVNASPTHMYQLFANLIGNAITHNDSDCPRIEVTRLAGRPPGRPPLPRAGQRLGNTA